MSLPPIPYRRTPMPPRLLAELEITVSVAGGSAPPWIASPEGLRRAEVQVPIWRCSFADLAHVAARCGVYEWGGPTGARPGRFWLTARPEPWHGSPAHRWRRHPFLLACVLPVEAGPGWLNWYWQIDLRGDADILRALGWLAEQAPRRCRRHGRVSCLSCRWAEYRGESRDWQCACSTCASLPAPRPAGRPVSPLHDCGDGERGPLVSRAWWEDNGDYQWRGPDDADLICAACGTGIVGDAATVAEALAADAAWDEDRP